MKNIENTLGKSVPEEEFPDQSIHGFEDEPGEDCDHSEESEEPEIADHDSIHNMEGPARAIICEIIPLNVWDQALEPDHDSLHGFPDY